MAAKRARKKEDEELEGGEAEKAAVPVAQSQLPLKGTEKAAALLLALGEDFGAGVWRELDDTEIAAISIAMSKLGTLNANQMESLLGEFVSLMSMSGALMGGFESTERLLMEFLPQDRVSNIMEEIRGPAGRNMWEKLSNVQANVLANYLKNEYPQTVAVILSKISSSHAARVLTILPEDFALEVVRRMLGMDAVQRDILDKIEATLRSEFISNLAQTRQRDAHEMMAEIFNNFDRQTESKFLTSLEEDNRESADRIKTLMFTFDDLARLDNNSCQTLLRYIEKDVLTLAIKGTTDRMREFFFGNMSERAGKMLKDDLKGLGPVRLSEVDEAQNKIIATAKELAAKGEIVIQQAGTGDQIIM